MRSPAWSPSASLRRAFLAFLLHAPPVGAQAIRLDVTRDLWVSSVPQEARGNNGGASRLKVKSYQEMSIFDVDPARLAGRTVRRATLHVRLAGEQRLRRMTVGSVAAEWVEGTGSSYAQQAGSSTFRSRRHPSTPWTLDGGDLGRVTLGQGGSAWRMAEATAPDRDGWQTIAIDPGIVALRIAGLSSGFLLFDDTGTEWTRVGEKFTVHHMPNRYIYSREQNRAIAPYVTLEAGPDDRQPPAAVAALTEEPGTATLPAGEVRLSWRTPRDAGPAGVVGFRVRVDNRDVPRDLVPLAGRPGARVLFHLRDLGTKPGQSVAIAVRAVDGAGNAGPETRGSFVVSSHAPPALPGQSAAVPTPSSSARPVTLGAGEVAILDELDKVNLESGQLTPPQPDGYPGRNHLWDASTRRVTLHAARNEFVAFQVLVRGAGRPVDASIAFADPTGRIVPRIGRYRAVRSKAGPMPDPIVPLNGPEDNARADRASYQSVHVELFVPHAARSGFHEGTLTLRAGPDETTLPVSLTVWDFTLPDVLSFLPEMNCYGLPAAERDYYRLAHLHRTALNRVPYSQAGEVTPGCAPVWNAKTRTFDWSAYDARFGPLLDGTAFADLPRKGVPLPIFYLPLHENWPAPIEPNYNGGSWADEAFTPEYRATFVEASRQFARHIDGQQWDETLFQCFFNGKWNFKERGWSRGSSPWLLDEPASFQDFWALRYFGAAFHEGVHAARRESPGRGKLVFRCDISRPEWQRDSLDGLLDYNVVSSALRPHRRIVLDRKARDGQVVLEYGSANPIEESNAQAVGWSVDAWSLGVDGVLPWQTLGRGDSWRDADTLALFYPPLNGKEPVPSVRLKAFRRGQQDVEYLTLLTETLHEPRWSIGQRVREALKLAGERGGSGFVGGEDAGLVRYRGLKPQDLWALRVRVGAALSQAHPAPKRSVVDLRTPDRDPATLEPRLVSEPTANPR